MKNLWIASAALAAALVAPAAAQETPAVTPVIDGNGVLTGAKGVVVGGQAYDVEFVDGTCAALFDGCDADGDFAFNSFEQAHSAGRSLFDQLLAATWNGHDYRKTPGRIAGCTPRSCHILIPARARVTPAGDGVAPIRGWVGSGVSISASAGGSAYVPSQLLGGAADRDVSAGPMGYMVYARFTPAGTAPATAASQ